MTIEDLIKIYGSERINDILNNIPIYLEDKIMKKLIIEIIIKDIDNSIIDIIIEERKNKWDKL